MHEDPEDETRGGDTRPGGSSTGDETRVSDAATTPAPAGMGLQTGDRFGDRYRILKELGAGGMGVVYQAWDQTLNVVVALKMIRAGVGSNLGATKDLERRFKQELLLARSVTHKNVVRIHDLGVIDGTTYITMTFVEGEDLSTILRGGALPLDRVLPMARQVAAGLAAAHEAGIVHRDLKPANIMIDAEGQALIMDFGIAQQGRKGSGTEVRAPEPGPVPGQAGEVPDSSATVLAPEAGEAVSHASGPVVGTIEYMSPEQSKGLPVDHRSDIYAFGLILSDLLLGPRSRTPGQTPWEALTDRISTTPKPLRSRDASIPADVDAVVTTCLQLAPGDRYQKTSDLVAALDRLDDQGNLIPEPRRWTAKTVTAAAVLVLGLVTGTWWFSRTAPPEPVSMLIGDFTNHTGDPVFDGLIEQALAVGVEGASFISVYPRRDARRIAAAASGSGGPLDAPAAKLVSMREGLDVIVGGDISTEGTGLALRVTAARSENDELLLDWTTRAASRDEVLDAVGRLAAQVRATLGDRKTARATSDAETFTASSLAAAKAYTEAQELQWEGRFEEALEAYQRALAIDSGFGRAHAGMAALYANLGRPAEAEKSYLAALSHLDRMTDREKFRTRGGYYLFKKNSEKASEEFEALVAQFPADSSGLANLALARFYRRDMAGALDTGRRAAAIYPKNVIRRNNAALFAMYAGDFDAAMTLANEVLALNPEFAKAYVAIGLSKLAVGRPEEATAAWDALAGLDTEAARSFAASGRIDLALFQDRTAEALRMLDAAIAADKKAGWIAAMGRRLAIKSDVLLGQGHTAAALRAAREAAASGREESILYLSGKTMIEAGESTAGLELASDLDNRLEDEPRIYAALLRGEAALAAGRPRDALTQFEAAQTFADTWLGRLSLGRAYLALKAFPEAASEFDRCLARKGEATAVFLDDVPSYRMVARAEALLKAARAGLQGR